MIAIKTSNISKAYKLYDNKSDRLKEAINPFKKSYHKDFFALKNISFDIKKGETIGILGKNGSGKSTLLKIITGVLTQTGGYLNVNGKICALLELGAGFNPEYTGIENIYLNGTLMGYEKRDIDKKLSSIIKFADIGDFIYQPVKSYSSGMFARLAFSVAISTDPDILIVDEALSVGDVFFQQKCNLYMKENMKGVTKLLVTHDINSVAKLTDRVLVLSKGELVFDGDPLEGIEFYVRNLHNDTYRNEDCIKKSTSNLIKEYKFDKWIDVEESKLSGALEAKICKYYFSINEQDYIGYVENRDIITLKILVKSQKNIKNTILGYLVNDKYGNIVFGQNSITVGFNNINLKGENYNIISLKFTWPEIKEGEYFITIGVGEGEHETQHVIQCWAHNIIKLNNISPNKTIHGLFNGNIIDISSTVLDK